MNAATERNFVILLQKPVLTDFDQVTPNCIVAARFGKLICCFDLRVRGGFFDGYPLGGQCLPDPEVPFGLNLTLVGGANDMIISDVSLSLIVRAQGFDGARYPLLLRINLGFRFRLQSTIVLLLTAIGEGI